MSEAEEATSVEVDEAVPAWRRIHPLGDWRDPVLEAIEREVKRPETVAQLSAAEELEKYPHAILERLYHLGLSAILGEADGTAADASTMTPYHLYALNAILGARSGSLAITVGVNFLALLPVWIAGSAQQIRRVSRRVSQGSFVAMALSEIDHGSDILRNETRAQRGTLDEHGTFAAVSGSSQPFTHYRIVGEKQLINGATFHDLIVAFVKTRSVEDGQFGPIRNFSFLVVFRDKSVKGPRRSPSQHATMHISRWPTLPTRAADIANLRFTGTLVPKEDLLGREGSGFELLQKTLAMSRGGVGAIAAGASSRARELACAYGRSRVLGDKAIVQLAPVADHLLRLEALDLLVAALANKACAMVNALGFGAAHYTAVAKFACTTLTVEAVHEGYRVLSARALVRNAPYEQLLRDVLLYGVFEGTTHVMLDRIQARLAQLTVLGSRSSSLDELGAIYRARPRRVLEICRAPTVSYFTYPDDHAQALQQISGVPLDALVAFSRAFLEICRQLRSDGRWEADGSLRFELAELYAHLETLFALVELADADRRAALGMEPIVGIGARHDLAYRFALGDFGVRITRNLRTISLRAKTTVTDRFDAIEEQLLDIREGARGGLRDQLAGTAAASSAG